MKVRKINLSNSEIIIGIEIDDLLKIKGYPINRSNDLIYLCSERAKKLIKDRNIENRTCMYLDRCRSESMDVVKENGLCDYSNSYRGFISLKIDSLFTASMTRYLISIGNTEIKY